MTFGDVPLAGSNGMAFGPRSSGEAKYHQVADRIRAAIQSGELRPGQALPTEKQLAAQYGVSRPTVRSALATLRAEGLIDAQQGRGAFVRLRPATRRLQAPQLSDAVTQSTHAPDAQQHIIEAGPAPARGAVAELLGIEDGHQAFVRRRFDHNASGRTSGTQCPLLPDHRETRRPGHLPYRLTALSPHAFAYGGYDASSP